MPRERHELRFGKYRTPNYRIGQRVQCAVRGNVRIVGVSTGLIPWPLGRKAGNNNRDLVIYHGLKRAIAKESAVAVCHWWGVTNQTVSRWRGIMGIGPMTPGSTALRRNHSLRNWANVKPKFHAKAHDPERAAKIAAAKLGKPRPPHVIEALRQSHLGKAISAETRAKMRAARLRYLESKRIARG